MQDAVLGEEKGAAGGLIQVQLAQRHFSKPIAWAHRPVQGHR